jgi:2-iminobutanoate/2-iminopropanoate deaminase
MQAEQALHNIEAILRAAGSSLDRVVRATAYLTNMDDFGIFNEVYARYFPEDFPARTCVEVSRLPLGALVEIDVIAEVGPARFDPSEKTREDPMAQRIWVDRRI